MRSATGSSPRFINALVARTALGALPRSAGALQGFRPSAASSNTAATSPTLGLLGVQAAAQQEQFGGLGVADAARQQRRGGLGTSARLTEGRREDGGPRRVDQVACSNIVVPMPMASPLTAATTGFSAVDSGKEALHGRFGTGRRRVEEIAQVIARRERIAAAGDQDHANRRVGRRTGERVGHRAVHRMRERVLFLRPVHGDREDGTVPADNDMLCAHSNPPSSDDQTRISNRPAAPMPPPTHMVTTPYLALRRRPSIRIGPASRDPVMP
jgi:hypothetical protein